MSIIGLGNYNAALADCKSGDRAQSGKGRDGLQRSLWFL